MVYIDESGDEGFRFPETRGGKGSSEWFVIAGVITRKETDLDTVKLINRVRARIHTQPKNTDPLHFAHLSHEQRLPLIDEIASSDLPIVAILFHKPSILNREIFSQKNMMYHYAARYLLERVSWCCRDWATETASEQKSAEVHFSNRGGLSMQDFQHYLYKLMTFEQTTIDWNVIDPDQCQVLAPKKSMGQQIADAVASGFYFGVRELYGLTEPRYAQMLRPVVYNDAGRYGGFGVKVWPKEYKVTLSPLHRWLGEMYGID